ncbi:hypothetical protein J6590_089924 [Homalodisca vitripennis]|nr:hypothetical protein J6590_089924 [Homalodisca vitripennis]
MYVENYIKKSEQRKSDERCQKVQQYRVQYPPRSHHRTDNATPRMPREREERKRHTSSQSRSPRGTVYACTVVERRQGERCGGLVGRMGGGRRLFKGG